MKYQLNNPLGDKDGTKNKNKIKKGQEAHGWQTEEDNNGRDYLRKNFKKGPTFSEQVLSILIHNPKTL